MKKSSDFNPDLNHWLKSTWFKSLNPDTDHCVNIGLFSTDYSWLSPVKSESKLHISSDHYSREFQANQLHFMDKVIICDVILTIINDN